MIELNEEQLKRAQELLRHIPGAVPKAVANAINRAAEGARTDAVKKAREEYMIPAGRVRETIDVRKASPDKLFASVTSKGRPRALSYFKIRPSRPTKRRPDVGVFAQVKRGGGGTIKGAFVAQMKSGHVGVFHRAGKARLPIIQRYGPSVPQMLGSPTVSAYIEKQAKERLDTRLEHEINRILKGWGK